jgi:hypothetical protein
VYNRPCEGTDQDLACCIPPFAPCQAKSAPHAGKNERAVHTQEKAQGEGKKVDFFSFEHHLTAFSLSVLVLLMTLGILRKCIGWSIHGCG